MSKQDISIELLRPGMHVVGIDISWLDSPFLRHSFRIESNQDIKKLIDAGVKIVTIERSKSDVLPEQVEAQLVEQEKQLIQSPKTEVQEKKAIPENLKIDQPANDNTAGPTSLKQELGVARQLHGDVKKLCARVFEQLNNGKAIDVAVVSELVEQTAASLSRNNQALFTFLHMQRKDEGLYDHAFSVFSLVLAMANMLGLDKDEQELLAFAALVHDVGWLKLPMHLLGKGKPYNDAERNLVHKHPLLSARMLEGGEGVTEELKSLVAMHHEHQNGSGYPSGKEIEGNRLLAILCVADRYDELVHQLLDQPGLIPKAALRQLYKDAQDGCHDIKIVQCLITLMGVYPISSALKLKSGEKAVVTECHRDAPAQPTIRIYYDSKGQLLPKPKDINLSELVGEDPRQVEKAIDWRLPGNDPAGVLNISEADLR